MLQSSCFQLCAVIGLFCSSPKAASLFKPRKKLCITIGTVFEETIKHFLYIVHPLPLPLPPPPKVNNRNRRKRCERCVKLAINTPESPHRCCSGIFIVNFEHISYPLEIQFCNYTAKISFGKLKLVSEILIYLDNFYLTTVIRTEDCLETRTFGGISSIELGFCSSIFRSYDYAVINSL